jgi:hypothetical protein
MKQKTSMKYRLLATLTLAALNYGIWFNVWARQENISPGSDRMAYSLQAALLMVLVIDVIVLLQVWGERWLLPLRRLRQRLGWVRWMAVILVGLIPAWFYYFSPLSVNFRGPFIRLIINLFFLGLMAWLAAEQEDVSFEWNGLLAAVIVFGSLFALGSVFREVSSFPFGLYWSEGNRFYDYSILFGRDLYHYESEIPLTAYIDPARQSLWGLIFLLPNVSIWAMRFWNGIIFSVPYVLLGWLSIKYKQEYGKRWLLFGLWTFLFLNQGPIYTPLVLAAILVVSTRRMPLPMGFAIMVVAGIYARLGRMTWMFAPAMLAAVIALLEAGPSTQSNGKTFLAALTGRVNQNDQNKDKDYISRIRSWQRAICLGIGGLFGGYFLPLLVPQIRSILPGGGGGLSVEGLSQTVGRQPLLWDRLLPNTTYPSGILLGLLLAISPLVCLLTIWIGRGQWKLDLWQKLVLGLTILSFLGVGIVISVKIGGGNNLHNLDMLFLALLFAAALAWEAGASHWITERQLSGWVRLLLLATLVIPAWPGIMQATAHTYPSEDRVSEVISDLRLAVADAAKKGDVLFLDQRQLLTFGTIQDVPLISEYEKKLLMDEAMADNEAYFKPFFKDLAAHRFSLIISEPLLTYYQSNITSFSNENNAWVKWISIPVLCYYQPVMTYQEFGVQLLIPKEKSAPKLWLACP